MAAINEEKDPAGKYQKLGAHSAVFWKQTQQNLFFHVSAVSAVYSGKKNDSCFGNVFSKHPRDTKLQPHVFKGIAPRSERTLCAYMPPK